jgi:alpha-N-arabinofuranosidase
MTLRDGVHTALTFDIFNRHCEKFAMGNVAQTVNCIHSLFLAHEDNFVRTPAYYAFELYAPHMGGRRVPLKIQVDEMTVPVLAGATLDGSTSEDPMKTISRGMPALSGSASIKERRLAVSLTNPSLEHAVTTRLRLGGGGTIREGRARVLTHEDANAQNTFDNPDEVGLTPLAVEVSGSAASVTLPKHAVATIELELA